MSVTGGPGGTDARLDDMELTADRLSDLAEELAQLCGDSALAGLDPSELGYAVLAPIEWAKVERAQGEFAIAVAGLALELAMTAGSLRAAACAYRATEDAIDRVVDGVLTGLGNVAGHIFRLLLPGLAVAGIVIYVGAALIDAAIEHINDVHGTDCDPIAVPALERAAQILIDTGVELLSGAVFGSPDVVQLVLEHILPGFVAGSAGVPPGMSVAFDDGPWPDDSQELTELVLSAGRMFGLFAATGIVAKKVMHAAADSRRGQAAPRTFTQLYSQQLTTHRGHENGRVRVDLVRGADGRRRAVVYIPATTDWSVKPGRNSTDTTTNVETVAGQDSVMRELVRQALADQHLPPGTEVMLVGYSQGGIVAMSLANDPGFRSSYTVTTVVTVGSPVADFADIPDSIEVMSIEHSNDLVPALDGGDNPDRSTWTTVSEDARLADGASPAHAHSGDAYAETIERLERDGNPALDDFRQRRGEFFDGTIESSSEYEGERS